MFLWSSFSKFSSFLDISTLIFALDETVYTMSYLCEYCGKTFTRRHNLLRHSERQHGGLQFQYSCTLCKKSFSNRHIYNSHMSKHLKNKNWNIFKSAFSGSTKIFRKALKTTSFLELFLVKPSIEKLIKQELLIYPRLKFNLSVVAEYLLESEPTPQIEQFILKSCNCIATVSKPKELSNQIDICLSQLRTREDQLNLRESGWILKAIIFIDVHLTQINILL